MTSADSNDLMPAQEKLEWVTPKISLITEEAAGTPNKYATPLGEINSRWGPS
jgi:hypothetical protein